MRQLQYHLVLGHMRVGKSLLNRIHGRAGHLALEQRQPIGSCLLPEKILQNRNQNISILQAIRKRAEPGIFRQFRRPQNAYQILKKLLLGAHDHEPSVLSRHHLRRDL